MIPPAGRSRVIGHQIARDRGEAAKALSGGQMSRIGFRVGPAWPTSLSSYGHLRTRSRPDFSWEVLRRNADYQADAIRTPPTACTERELPQGGRLIRLLEPTPARTDFWGVRPFC